MKVVEGTDMFHRRAQALLRPVLGTQLGRVFLVAAGGKLVLTAVGTEDGSAAWRNVLSFLNGATTAALAYPVIDFARAKPIQHDDMTMGCSRLRLGGW